MCFKVYLNFAKQCYKCFSKNCTLLLLYEDKTEIQRLNDCELGILAVEQIKPVVNEKSLALTFKNQLKLMKNQINHIV